MVLPQEARNGAAEHSFKSTIALDLTGVIGVCYGDGGADTRTSVQFSMGKITS